MRIVYEEMRDWSPFTGKEEFESAQLRLICKNETEFYAAWEFIKDIDGVIWSGCPAIEQNEYSDIVVSVAKGRGDTIKDVKDTIAYYRKVINETLKGARV
jgi:hypothetical protein